jgi:quinol monooxygenase YgiN
VLIEVYCDDSAPAEHKKTAHYQTWRDTVAVIRGDWQAVQVSACLPLTAYPD